MAEAAIALQAVGSLVQGVGAYKAGQANKRAAYAQALEEERTGNAEELRVRDAGRAAIGAQIAGQFGNGFQGGSGSALDALTESQVNAALDALTIRRDAAGKARSLRAQGDQASSQGKFALASSILGAGSAIAGGKSDWAAAKRGTSGGAG